MGINGIRQEGRAEAGLILICPWLRALHNVMSNRYLMGTHQESWEKTN
jgi:hypothetical protein